MFVEDGCIRANDGVATGLVEVLEALVLPSPSSLPEVARPVSVVDQGHEVCCEDGLVG